GFVAVSVELFNRETQFGAQIGNATLNFVLMQSFVGLFPVSILYAIAVGVAMQVIHAVSIAVGPSMDVLVRLFYGFHLQCVFVVTTIVIGGREWLSRREFLGRYRHRPSLVDHVSEEGVTPSAVEAHAEISVIFVDVVGFSLLTEKLAPRHT